MSLFELATGVIADLSMEFNQFDVHRLYGLLLTL